MSAIQALLDHYRELADQHRAALAGLESGKVRIFNGAGIDREITPQWVEIYKRWICELESIIAKYDGKDA